MVYAPLQSVAGPLPLALRGIVRACAREMQAARFYDEGQGL